MFEIKYKIKTKSPVVILTNTPDQNTASTLDYIPGYVLIGALANIYMRNENFNKELHKDELFYDMFLNDKIAFSNGYISEIINEREYDFQPLSFFIQTDKNKEKYGFFPLMNLQDRKSIQDVSGGYGIIEKIDDDEFLYKTTIKKNYNFHIVREDRICGFSKDDGIFQYEFIEENQVFNGSIKGEKTTLDKFFKYFKNTKLLFIGKSKNTQYGLCEIKFSVPKAISNDRELEDIVHFTFNSNAIFINKYGYTDNSIKNIKEYLNQYFCENSYEITNTIFRTELIENYSSIKQSKNLVNTISKGSSFTIEFKKNIDENKILKLLENGIGERINEGFGELRIVDYKNINKSILKEKGSPIKPQKLPELLKLIVEKVIFKKTEEHIRKKAFEKANEFFIIPTNSQIGKLEKFLNDSEDMNNFRSKIKSLRETSKEHLNNCRTINKTLLDLINSDIKIETIYGTEIVKMCKKERIVNLEEYEFRFTKLYFLTIFKRMRKINKSEKEGE